MLFFTLVCCKNAKIDKIPYPFNAIVKNDIEKENLSIEYILQSKDSTFWILNSKKQIGLIRKPKESRLLTKIGIEDTLVIYNKKISLYNIASSLNKFDIKYMNKENLSLTITHCDLIHIRQNKFISIRLSSDYVVNNNPTLHFFVLFEISNKKNNFYIIPNYGISWSLEELSYYINDFDNNGYLNIIFCNPFVEEKQIQLYEINEFELKLLKKPYLTIKSYKNLIIDTLKSDF